MKLAGKTREEIEAATRKLDRRGLVDLIFSLVSVEQHFTPGEIAERSRVSARTVLDDIRRGRLSPFFKRGPNRVTVPASAVNRWRDGFRIQRGEAA